MKKIAISVALSLAALGVAGAMDAPAQQGEQAPPALPPVMTTGSSTLDAQIKALRQGYESQIKALRDEYASKLKALIGDKKPMMGTSTRPMKDGKGTMNGSTSPHMEDKRLLPSQAQGKVEGVTVEGQQNGNVPKGNAWGFFKKFFGIEKGEN